MAFVTDVENAYFTRRELPGKYHAEIVGETESAINHSLTLHSGFAHWSIELPEDARIGDKLVIQCQVSDEVIGNGFINVAKLTVKPTTTGGGPTSSRRSRKGNEEKNGSGQPSGVQMPRIEKVREEQWPVYDFDKHTACRVIRDQTGENGDSQTESTFYINVDNLCLRTEMKYKRNDPKVVEAKFMYANVLVGLALLKDDLERQKKNEDAEEENPEDGEVPVEARIEQATKALAPFLIPMIDNLGALTTEDVASVAEVGDEE